MASRRLSYLVLILLQKILCAQKERKIFVYSGNTIMDPTYTEERVGVAQLTLGMNSYRELCSLHFDYLTKTMIVEDVISAVSNDAANYATRLVQQIKDAVTKDVQARYVLKT